MKKFFKFIVLLFVSCLSACSENILVVDKANERTFSIENQLDEIITISGIVNNNPFSLTLSSKDSYSYYHDTMSGHVEKGKTPVYLATSVKIVGKISGAVEYPTSLEFKENWIEGSEHQLVFRITSSLFKNE